MVSGTFIKEEKVKVVSDETVLGSSEFIQRLPSEAQEREKETLRLSLGDTTIEFNE